jgi:uncharacterized protein
MPRDTAPSSEETRPAPPPPAWAAPTPVTPTSLAPVKPGERILSLDVLRGIALFGVLAANIWLWFSGVVFRFPEYQAEIFSFSPDSLAFLFVGFFISGKAITTFSFLFGLGFAVQMIRAEERGRSIVGHHSKRLAILLLFGVLHGVLLWYGDILAAYALLGFALLLFRNRSQRTVLAWAAILIVVVPIALGALPVVMGGGGGESGPDPAKVLGTMAERNETHLALFASAEPGQVIRGNLSMLRTMWLSPKALFLVGIFGIFLLGLYAGRRRIFENPAAHRTLLMRLIGYGFPIGMAGTMVTFAIQSLPPEQRFELTWLPLAMAVAGVAGMVPFALAYIATATLLLERPAWRRLLSAFAPVGRMALTNYLAQTIICLAIFYQGGLIGEVGPLFGLIVALVVFPVQMAASAWWLARFRFGPIEWLWRSLTYRRLQPMRLAPEIELATPTS